jgi:hypothetical protein
MSAAALDKPPDATTTPKVRNKRSSVSLNCDRACVVVPAKVDRAACELACFVIASISPVQLL